MTGISTTPPTLPASPLPPAACPADGTPAIVGPSLDVDLDRVRLTLSGAEKQAADMSELQGRALFERLSRPAHVAASAIGKCGRIAGAAGVCAGLVAAQLFGHPVAGAITAVVSLAVGVAATVVSRRMDAKSAAAAAAEKTPLNDQLTQKAAALAAARAEVDRAVDQAFSPAALGVRSFDAADNAAVAEVGSRVVQLADDSAGEAASGARFMVILQQHGASELDRQFAASITNLASGATSISVAAALYRGGLQAAAHGIGGSLGVALATVGTEVGDSLDGDEQASLQRSLLNEISRNAPTGADAALAAAAVKACGVSDDTSAVASAAFEALKEGSNGDADATVARFGRKVWDDASNYEDANAMARPILEHLANYGTRPETRLLARVAVSGAIASTSDNEDVAFKQAFQRIADGCEGFDTLPAYGLGVIDDASSYEDAYALARPVMEALETQSPDATVRAIAHATNVACNTVGDDEESDLQKEAFQLIANGSHQDSDKALAQLGRNFIDECASWENADEAAMAVIREIVSTTSNETVRAVAQSAVSSAGQLSDEGDASSVCKSAFETIARLP